MQIRKSSSKLIEPSFDDFNASSKRFKFNKAAPCVACIIPKQRNNGEAKYIAHWRNSVTAINTTTYILNIPM